MVTYSRDRGGRSRRVLVIRIRSVINQCPIAMNERHSRQSTDVRHWSLAANLIDLQAGNSSGLARTPFLNRRECLRKAMQRRSVLWSRDRNRDSVPANLDIH